jgi:two-component system response regulator FixJ
MPDEHKIYVVDDDAAIRDSMRALLESAGFSVQVYSSAAQFLTNEISTSGCLIADIRMPNMTGLELQEEITRRRIVLPVIIMTGHGDVPLAVQAMKAGAIDFIEKPFTDDVFLACIERALAAGKVSRGKSSEISAAKDMLALLTPRETSVLNCLMKGHSNKVAAYELDISPRTVEIHRAHVMNKLKARSLSDVVRTALAADHLGTA